MAQVNDLYEITLTSFIHGKEAANVFHYIWDTDFITVPESDKNVSRAIAVSFKRAFFDTSPGLPQISTSDVTYTSIRARNLFDESDSYNIEIAATGVSGGGTSPGANETLPSFVAQSFTLNAHNGMKGHKRFPGIGETQTADGVVLPIVANDIAWRTIEDKLKARLMLPPLWLSNLAAPVIVKRVRTGTPGNYQYRLPSQQSEAVFGRVVFVLFNVLLTSQVSRKK